MGTSRMATDATTNRATTSIVSRPVRRIAHMPAKVWASVSHGPSRAITAIALAPAPASRRPKTRQGS